MSGQLKVGNKTNEITEIPKLLEMLDIVGNLVTIAAKANSVDIVDRSADSLLAVKGNQSLLEEAFNAYYQPVMLQSFDGDSYSSQEKSHDCLETRAHW